MYTLNGDYQEHSIDPINPSVFVPKSPCENENPAEMAPQIKEPILEQTLSNHLKKPSNRRSKCRPQKLPSIANGLHPAFHSHSPSREGYIVKSEANEESANAEDAHTSYHLNNKHDVNTREFQFKIEDRTILDSDESVPLTPSKRRPRRNPVWRYFLVDQDGSLARCKHCDYNTKSVYSTNLKVHLRTHHKKIFENVLEAENIMNYGCKKALNGVRLQGIGSVYRGSRKLKMCSNKLTGTYDDQPLHTFLLDTLMKTVVANNSDEFMEHQVMKQKEQQYIGHNKDAKVDQASQLTETGNDCEGSDLKIVQDIIEELSKEHHLQRQSTAPIKKSQIFTSHHGDQIVQPFQNVKNHLNNDFFTLANSTLEKKPSNIDLIPGTTVEQKPNQMNCSLMTNSRIQRRRRLRRHPVWNYFTDVGEKLVGCILCQFQTSSAFSTNLKMHLRAHHKGEYLRVMELELQMRIEETGSVSDESLQDPSISGTGIHLTTNRKRRRKTTDEIRAIISNCRKNLTKENKNCIDSTKDDQEIQRESLPQNLNDQQQLSTGLGIDMAQFFVKHFMQQSTKCLQKSSYLPSASNTFSASNHLSADTTKTGCYIKERYGFSDDSAGRNKSIRIASYTTQKRKEERDKAFCHFIEEANSAGIEVSKLLKLSAFKIFVQTLADDAWKCPEMY